MLGYTIIKTKELEELYDLLEQAILDRDSLHNEKLLLIKKHQDEKRARLEAEKERLRERSLGNYQPGFGSVPGMVGSDPMDAAIMTSVLINQAASSPIYTRDDTTGGSWFGSTGSYSTDSTGSYDSTGTGGDSTGTGGD